MGMCSFLHGPKVRQIPKWLMVTRHRLDMQDTAEVYFECFFRWTLHVLFRSVGATDCTAICSGHGIPHPQELRLDPALKLDLCQAKFDSTLQRWAALRGFSCQQIKK